MKNNLINFTQLSNAPGFWRSLFKVSNLSGMHIWMSYFVSDNLMSHSGSNVILCIEGEPLIRLSSGNLFFSSMMQNQNIWEWKLGVSFFWCWIKREAIFKHKYSWMEKESTISIEWNPRRSGPWAALSGFQDLNGSGMFFPQLTENDIYSSLQVVPSGLFLSLNYFTWYKPRL